MKIHCSFSNVKLNFKVEKKKKMMPKMDYLTHFLSKNEYNDVLCLNGSKVTAL